MRDWTAGAAEAASAVQGFISRPWTLLQIGLIAACLASAVLVQRMLEPPLEAQVRRIRGKPRLLRFLAFVLRRIRWVVLPLLLWACALVLQALTVPGGAYFLSLAATLALAWLVVALASRIIRTHLLARAIAVLVWGIVALSVLGYWDDVARLLEAAVLPLGEINISLLDLMQGMAVFIVLFWAARLLGDFAEARLSRSSDLTPSLQVLLGKVLKIVMIAVAVLVPLNVVGVDLTAFALFSGAVGVGIGFGLQKVVSNFISGVIILLDKSIKPGDVITLGNTFGWIQSLRARFVSVVTRDGFEYLIPNEDFITQQVVNWSFSSRLVRQEVEFGVSYSADPHEVRRIAVEAATSVARVESSPAPVCHLVAFGESSLDFKLRFWITDPQEGLWNVKGLVLLACWDAFKANGIAIPYPHREIVLSSPVRVERSDAPEEPLPRD